MLIKRPKANRINPVFDDQCRFSGIVINDTQTYRLIRAFNHECKDGHFVQMTEWQTSCPDCGADFKTTTKACKWPSNRRCRKCAMPRIKVGKSNAPKATPV